MEEMLMTRVNEDGKLIQKSVPENLVSNYIMIGWELVKKEKEKEIKPLVKDEKKLND